MLFPLSSCQLVSIRGRTPRLYIQHRMKFIPSMVGLRVKAADPVDSYVAPNCRRSQTDWVDDLANDERCLAVWVINQLEDKISVLFVMSYLAYVAFRDHVRLGV